ncbi:hypothetical protein GCM10010240_32740 [Streptomyces griseoviridis]|nr:hypothetical protein GCM10010240_32740 [Streptomyces griseoviridis]
MPERGSSVPEPGSPPPARGARTPVPGRDPGLQPERTRLAWRRTTLSGAVAAVLAAKTALQRDASAVSVLAGSLTCVLWLGLLFLAHRRITAVAASPRPAALGPRHATALALCTVAMAGCGAVLIIG